VSATKLCYLKEDEEELAHQWTSGLLAFFAITKCESSKSPAKG
jgi:hypothetical protein